MTYIPRPLSIAMPIAEASTFYSQLMCNIRGDLLKAVNMSAAKNLSLDETIKKCWTTESVANYLEPATSVNNPLSSRKALIRTLISDAIKIYINRMDDPVNG